MRVFFFPMGAWGVGVGLCAGREPGTGSGRDRGGFFFCLEDGGVGTFTAL